MEEHILLGVERTDHTISYISCFEKLTMAKLRDILLHSYNNLEQVIDLINYGSVLHLSKKKNENILFSTIEESATKAELVEDKHEYLEAFDGSKAEYCLLYSGGTWNLLKVK